MEGGAFNRYTLDGGTEILPSELFDGKEKMENYFKSNEYEELVGNNLTLQKNRYRCFTEAMIVISALSAGLPTGCRIGNTQFARNAANP